MTHSSSARVWFAAVLTFGLAAASAAHAFTFQGAEGYASSPPQSFMDLGEGPGAADQPTAKFGNGRTAAEQGNFSSQFGNQRTFRQRYDFNSQFDRYDPFGKR